MQRTPLHIAAEEGARDKVLLLLAHGADPSATDKNMWTPLHCAASGVRFRSSCPPALSSLAADDGSHASHRAPPPYSLHGHPRTNPLPDVPQHHRAARREGRAAQCTDARGLHRAHLLAQGRRYCFSSSLVAPSFWTNLRLDTPELYSVIAFMIARGANPNLANGHGEMRVSSSVSLSLTCDLILPTVRCTRLASMGAFTPCAPSLSVVLTSRPRQSMSPTGGLCVRVHSSLILQGQ